MINSDRKKQFVASLFLSLPSLQAYRTRRWQCCPPTLSHNIPSILLVCAGDASTWLITVESSFSFGPLMHISNKSYLCTKKKNLQNIIPVLYIMVWRKNRRTKLWASMNEDSICCCFLEGHTWVGCIQVGCTQATCTQAGCSKQVLKVSP